MPHDGSGRSGVAQREQAIVLAVRVDHAVLDWSTLYLERAWSAKHPAHGSARPIDRVELAKRLSDSPCAVEV